MKSKKLISWNVNGIRAAYKKGALDKIFLQDPDILGIQETKCLQSQLPENSLAPSGYFSYFDEALDRKGYSGTAVYTKIQPNKIIKGLGVPEFDREGRAITCIYDDLIFITCYFPNGGRDADHFQFKLKYFDHMLDHIKKMSLINTRIVVCGDFNVAHHEIDLARPKENAKQIGFLPIERDKLSLYEASGLIDSFRFLNKEEIKYSWWDVKTGSRERNVGWRIDYMFIDQKHANEITSADILTEETGSDHAPTLLQLKY